MIWGNSKGGESNEARARRGKEEDFLTEKTALRYLEPALTWAFIPGSPLTLYFFLLSMAQPPPAPLPAPGGGRGREGGGFRGSFREPQDLWGHCSPWGTPRPTGFCSPRPVPAAALRTASTFIVPGACITIARLCNRAMATLAIINLLIRLLLTRVLPPPPPDFPPITGAEPH